MKKFLYLAGVAFIASAISIILMEKQIHTLMDHTNAPLIEFLRLIIISISVAFFVFLVIVVWQRDKAYNRGYAKAKREDVIETYMTLPLVSPEDDERYVTLLDSFCEQGDIHRNFWGVVYYYNGEGDKITKRVKLSKELDKNYKEERFQIMSKELFLIEPFS